MALQKPAKSKAPAFVQPAGGVSPTKVNDTCCIPNGYATQANVIHPGGGADNTDKAEWAVGHIKTPTAH